MTTPTAKDVPIPQDIAFLARFGLPAPMFWATKADRDWEKASGTSMMKAQTFPATPTPAEGITPRLFTIAEITKKEIFTRPLCNATGVLIRSILPMMRLRKRRCAFFKRTGSPFLRTNRMDSTTLNACAMTVASAAPDAAISNPATKIRSPIILKMHANNTVISGVLESPNPRNTLPNTL